MHADLLFADVQIFALHIDMRIFQIFDAACADCTLTVVGMSGPLTEGARLKLLFHDLTL